MSMIKNMQLYELKKCQKVIKRGSKSEVQKGVKSVKIAKVRKTPKMTKFRGVKNGQKLEKI